MKPSLLDMYVEIFARPALARFHRFLFLVGLRGLGVLNWRTDEQSGESYFLKSVIAGIDQDGLSVLDVGANEGDFVACVVENSSQLKVLGVEPHPTTFARLKQRFADGGNRVDLANIGAGAADATLSLYDYEGSDGTGHASFYKDVIEGIHHGHAKSFEVPVRRLDDLVAERGAKIAMIKIDVEGFERDVLVGLEKTIATQAVKYIVIEFNEMNVVSGSFVKNFMDMLPDYQPYRILPMGRLLPLDPYCALFVELFAYQNIAFIRK